MTFLWAVVIRLAGLEGVGRGRWGRGCDGEVEAFEGAASLAK